jgi:hypothetical protein
VVFTTENAVDVTQPYSEWEERIVRVLLLRQQFQLNAITYNKVLKIYLKGFVRASVQIIEARDPTTSGHSERVADLTVRLTEEANAITTGPLRGIYFSARQIQEVRYAALLHDFGKVGIPEALLGKRKKLYPEQLEVIRYRFALAQRTLEMECAQTKFRYLMEHPSHKHLDDGSTSECSHCQSLTKFDKQLAQTIETLNYYWELLQELNEPDVILTREFHAFSEETSAQLSALAEYTYRDTDGVTKPLISEAEMAQLLVPRGNLTASERSSIEAHVTHTYHFLGTDSLDKTSQRRPCHCLRASRKA